MRLRLIADDLTGALDAAAPFASPAQPVRLVLTPDQATAGDHVTFSSESRDLPQTVAETRVRAAHAALTAGTDGAALWFKKIDSVLRGHPFAETIALAQVGGFRRCVFTPAFPEMGRITRDGRAWHRGPDGAWLASWPGRLQDAFANARLPGVDVIILNAETHADLQAAVRPYLDDPATLWAGSGGLARAIAPELAPDLAGAQPPLALLRVGLFILGTTHPATRAQAAALAPMTTPAPSVGPITPMAQTPLMLDPVPISATAQQTHATLARALDRVARPADDSAICVTGGDCLATALQAIGATGLDCVGAATIGLPLSRIRGGRLDGVSLLSKSGGFGAADALNGFLPP